MAAAWLRSSTDQDYVRDAFADGHAGPMARTRVCPAAAVSRRGDLLAQRRLLIQPFGICHWHWPFAIRYLPFVQGSAFGCLRRALHALRDANNRVRRIVTDTLRCGGHVLDGPGDPRGGLSILVAGVVSHGPGGVRRPATGLGRGARSEP